MRLYNTLTQKTEEFTPSEAGHARVYVCGVTTYDFAHAGHGRTYTSFDVLVRHLRARGLKVTLVRNVTDVDDKILNRAQELGEAPLQLSQRMSDLVDADLLRIGCDKPTHEPRVSTHIPEILDLIAKLIDKGHAYVAKTDVGNDVYFSVRSFSPYGKLSRRNIDDLLSGARVETGDIKRDPLDFALWKGCEETAWGWPSPYGKGRPGWHIECSAMAEKYLGQHFDIHCGGIDHIPVHHTNEIAQSEACTGKPWVKVWMHSEFIMVNAEKMSKSKGKFIILDDVLERGLDPLVYRFLCLNSHYRAQLNFTWEILENAKNGFERLKNSVLALKASLGSSSLPAISSETARQLLERFTSAICDDLKMPLSMSVVWEAVGEKNLSDGEKLSLLLTLDQVLGFGMEKWQAASSEVPAEIQALLTEREAARKNKDFKRSDELRDKISELGYLVKDGAQGQKVTKR